MSDGKRLGFEKGKDFAKGRDVRGRSAGSHGKVVHIAKMNSDEYILITVIGGIGKRPVRSDAVHSERWTVETRL
jgi:hypothetical protein